MKVAKARRSFFAKKEPKKLLLAAAVEGPEYGRSKAGGNQKFFGSFFQKRTAFLAFLAEEGGLRFAYPPYGVGVL